MMMMTHIFNEELQQSIVDPFIKDFLENSSNDIFYI